MLNAVPSDVEAKLVLYDDTLRLGIELPLSTGTGLNSFVSIASCNASLEWMYLY